MDASEQRFRARLSAWFTARAPELCASLFALTWFFYLGYGATLLPTNIAWMYQRDWAAYLWGFLFFRNADWGFPLGTTPNLFYPYGTSVGFTDANPWVSVFFKVLSPVLPADFQFAGMWFLLCFVLEAVFGTFIARSFTRDPIKQTLGGALFAATPLLPSRADHVALCGIFFVTAGLHLHLSRAQTSAELKRRVAFALVLSIWAAGTHGYLSVMLLALVLSWFVQLLLTRAPLEKSKLVGAGLLTLLATVVTYWLFGYLGWKPADLTAEGFGQFSSDLNALINPQGWSRFFSALPFKPRQWEGFLYLGSGVFVLLAFSLFTHVRSPIEPWDERIRRFSPLCLTLLALWVYSLSSRVTYHGELVLNLEAFYEPLSRVTGIFRSSGRFGWPLHLALIALGIAGAARLRLWTGRALLLCALLLQVSELKAERVAFPEVALRPLHDPAWQTLGDDYRHLELLPLHLLWVCKYDAKLVNTLSYLAYRERLTFNSGNFMRKEPNVDRLCNAHLDPSLGLDPHTVYVVERRYLADFRRLPATCGTLDGLVVCASNERPTALLKALSHKAVLR